MMELDVEESPFRLEVASLKAAILNYSAAELKAKDDPADSSTNSTLRSRASDLWRVGSKVLLRSDPTHYSLQFLQLISQCGNGWIPVNLTEITDQHPIYWTLPILDFHGFILMDFERERIKISSLNLMREIREKCQFDVTCFDLVAIREFLRFLSIPPQGEDKISRPRHVGLTFTLRLALCHPQVTLTPEFHECFDQWVAGLSGHPSHELYAVEKWVLSAGIQLYEKVRSLHFRALEIIFLLRSRSERDGGRDDLDVILSNVRTYMTLAETALLVIPLRYIRPQLYFQHNPNDVESSEISRDYSAVGESLRKTLTLTMTSRLTPDILEVFDQLITFFLSGWNSWKCRQISWNGDEDYLAKVCFAGILNCWAQEGKPEEILNLVKETKKFMIQGTRVNQFHGFFPDLVMGHAKSLGPESAHQKESLLLELEPYLMCVFRGQADNIGPGYGSQRVLTHLFNCLVRLGNYQGLHGVITHLKLVVENWSTEITASRIEPFRRLPTALAASVRNMDFVGKEALMEAAFELSRTLVKVTLGLGSNQNVRKLQTRPIGALIIYCFETGMVHGLSGFLKELEDSLVIKYGERLQVITTIILSFGERVVGGLEHVGPAKIAISDWCDFLEQVKCCVVKWTQLISTPTHAQEKNSWMNGKAEFISRHIDSCLEAHPLSMTSRVPPV